MDEQNRMVGLQNPMSDQSTHSSYIQIIFQEPGSVVFQARMDGITPMQLLALAGYFELRAKNELVRLENSRIEQEENQKLAVPKIALPNDYTH